MYMENDNDQNKKHTAVCNRHTQANTFYTNQIDIQSENKKNDKKIG